MRSVALGDAVGAEQVAFDFEGACVVELPPEVFTRRRRGIARVASGCFSGPGGVRHPRWGGEGNREINKAAEPGISLHGEVIGGAPLLWRHGAGQRVRMSVRRGATR